MYFSKFQNVLCKQAKIIFLLLPFSSAAAAASAYNNGNKRQQQKTIKVMATNVTPMLLCSLKNVEYEFKFQLQQHQLLYMQLSIPSMFRHLTHPFFFFQFVVVVYPLPNLIRHTTHNSILLHSTLANFLESFF